MKQQSYLIMPIVYGIGTSLPVLIFALIMAFCSTYVAKAFKFLTQLEIWIRRITGTVFILAGIYYCLIHIYDLCLNLRIQVEKILKNIQGFIKEDIFFIHSRLAIYDNSFL